MVKPADRREPFKYLLETYGVSIRRCCRLMMVHRETIYYRSRKDPQAFLRMRIKEIAKTRPRYGYRRIHTILRREGWKINVKRVYRIYREEGLNLNRKPKKKRLGIPREPIRSDVNGINECWAMDFVSDQLYNGKRFRALTIIDTFTRECVDIYADKGITGDKVVEVLDKISKKRKLPDRIKVDNGPEFISKSLDIWAYFNKVKLDYSRPGKPTDNSHIESFNGSFRDECLNANWFMSLEDAKEKIEIWKNDYNEYRPHSSLTYKTPAEFAEIAVDVANFQVKN